MVQIGKYNNLRIVKEVDFGLYLDGEEYGEILLPLRYVPPNSKVDELIEVFIYLDSEDRIIATTEMPYAIVGDFALLNVSAVNKYGAFMDWGLLKELLVPFREQKETMVEGKSYIVYVYLDTKTNRIVASAKIDRFLDKEEHDFELNQEVDIFTCNKTDLGYKVIINKTHWGLIYENEVFQRIPRGKYLKAYIQKIREDDKIDVSLQKPGFEKIKDLSDIIIEKLKGNNGFLTISDKSPPEEIYKMFEVSKKSFKKAIGTLYKKKIIKIEKNSIKLLNSEE